MTKTELLAKIAEALPENPAVIGFSIEFYVLKEDFEPNLKQASKGMQSFADQYKCEAGVNVEVWPSAKLTIWAKA